MKKNLVIIILAMLASAAMLAGCGETNNNSITTSVSSNQENSAITSKVDSSSLNDESTTNLNNTKPEPNTSAMVDYIARQAKSDAASIDDAKIQESVNFIRDNYNNYFTDNNTMEKTMYYGYLLEYSCKNDSSKKDYANLGQDAYQVVKYVYRGAETIDSDSVKSNLEQIQKSLNKIK